MNITVIIISGPSGEYLQKMRETYELIEDSWNRFIDAWNTIISDYQTEYDGDLIASFGSDKETRSEYSISPNEYARKTASLRNRNRQNLYSKTPKTKYKPPIRRIN